VTKTGFRADDFKPYVFKTVDFGLTWTPIAQGLPDKPVNVLVEDPKNSQLLYLGNDKGVYVSLTGGSLWQTFQSNMPPSVPVHDLVIHPRENDLVVGTYGRGIFVADVSALQDWKSEIANAKLYLFSIEPKPLRLEGTQSANYHLYGNRHIHAPNEPNGWSIRYFTENVRDSLTINISDVMGKQIRSWKFVPKTGLSELIWNFRTAAPKGQRAQGTQVPPGDYLVTLEQAGQKQSKVGRFTTVLGWKIGPSTMSRE
jgi:hypothetical protein